MINEVKGIHLNVYINCAIVRWR